MQRHATWLPGVLWVLGLGFVTGCVSVPREAGFPDVQTHVEARAGYPIHWYQGAPEDETTQAALAQLLADTLTVEEAVQVALLNSRRLQATYEDLGVAQAAVIQAGLLRNPIFGGDVLFPTGGEAPDLGFEIAFDFLDIFYIPLRKAVARSAFEEAKLRVSGAVLDMVGQVRMTFYRAQAAQQRLELLEQVMTASTATYEAAVRLHEAGNIPDLARFTEQALFEQARLAQETAKALALEKREQLNQALGVWGRQANYVIARRLPVLPERTMTLDSLEAQAVSASLDLAVARQAIETRARRLGLTNTTALIPELELGVGGEREEGEWKMGPTASFSIPLFDTGKAKRFAAEAELRRQQANYFALGVEVRSEARIVRHRLQTTRQVAQHYADVLVPLRGRITRETQLHYNAMQIGVFQLLQAKQQEIDAGLRYIEALEAYWLAHTDLKLLQQGRRPSGNSPLRLGMMGMEPDSPVRNEEH